MEIVPGRPSARRWLRRVSAFTLVALMAGAALQGRALAQRGGGGGRGFFGGAFGCVDPPIHNIPYDGRFTFARLKYNGGPGTCYYRGEPSWAQGYG